MRPTTVVLIIVLCGVLFGAWFFTSYEKVSEERYVGYRGEARVNRFLAAEVLLQRFDIPADSQSSLRPSRWLPETTDTIVTPLSESFVAGDDATLMTEWVQNGGHLVLFPAADKTELTDAFVRYFGAEFAALEFDDEEIETEVPGDEPESEDEAADTVYTLDLDRTLHHIQVANVADNAATLSHDGDIIAVREGWGNGYVTLVSDQSFFTNDLIGVQDHARFLLDIVAGWIDPGTVWFIYNAEFPGLWELIWANAPYAVAGLALAFLVWLWAVMPRFGPRIEPEPTARRSIMEHIAAAGHFMWRHRGVGKLTESARHAVIREAEIRHSRISHLPLDKQARTIAKITGLPVEPVYRLLSGEHVHKHRDFTHSMQLLQRIRKEL